MAKARVIFFLCSTILILHRPLPAQPADSYFDSEQLNTLPDGVDDNLPPAEDEDDEAGPGPSYRAEGIALRRLLGRARAKRLHEADFWHRMLHYRGGVIGYKSEADGENFFLSKSGKTDPAAELDANIRAFFTPALPDGGDLRCVFPLRYKWLRRMLGSPPEFPVVECPGIKKYLDGVAVDSVSLIFASYYMNSPASMFGHTLIKLNSKKRGGMELLDYVVNFGADVGNANTLAYVWKGLTGGYPGLVTTLPYHVKVREYNDVESRDIWEYRLDLKPDDIENMLLHIVELEQTYFDYYYFDENCSYHLLSLIDIARPNGPRLTAKVRAWIVPGRMVRLVHAEKNLVERVEYRPSLFSEIRGTLETLDPVARAEFHRVLDDDRTLQPDSQDKRSDVERANFYDLLLKTLRFIKAAGDETPEQKALLDRLLVARAALPPAAPDPVRPSARRFSDPPHLGHEYWRAGLGGGVSSFGPYSELTLRGNFHDLMNDDTGFAPNSELEIMALRARLYAETDRAELDELAVFRVLSLPRLDPLTPSVSYLIDTGFTAELVERPGRPMIEQYLYWNEFTATERSLPELLYFRDWFLPARRSRDERFARVFPGYGDFQAGLSFAGDDATGGPRLSVLGGIRAEHAPGPVTLSRVGPALSLLSTLEVGAWKFSLSASYYGYSAGGDADAYRLGAGARLATSEQSELRLSARARPDWSEADLAFALFF